MGQAAGQVGLFDRSVNGVRRRRLDRELDVTWRGCVVYCIRIGLQRRAEGLVDAVARDLVDATSLGCWLVHPAWKPKQQLEVTVIQLSSCT